MFLEIVIIYGEELLGPRTNPSKTTAICQFSASVYSIYMTSTALQTAIRSSIRNLSTHHAVVKGTG